MELEFDKEIDAILRKGQLDSTAAASGVHLEAADISAFAENALPERAKQLYTAHLADCGRCRKILSQTIALNVEAEPVAASSDVVMPVTEDALPWYRRLLRLPTLAYAMGAFVLLFSGFLGYTVFQSMTGSTAMTDVSQVSDSRSAPASGPNAGEEQYSAMANTAATNSSSNSLTATSGSAANAANTVGSAVNSAGTGTLAPVTAPAAEPQPAEILTDGVAVAKDQPAAAAAPPMARNEAEADRDEERKAKAEDKNDAMDAAKQPSDDLKVMREKSRTGPAKKPAYSPRSDSRTQQTSPMLAGSASNKRKVNGRSFEKKDGVWYDTSYRGQATINIQRGTENYRNLDSGLRTIAESLDGIVVAVWKSKAYRIQ